MNKEQLYRALVYAYLEARKHKKKSNSHKRFYANLKENLLELCDDIYNWRYKISPSIYFIQMNPIQREVFAGNFRDRIVHHLIYDCISPYREKQFIYDCYSCRKDKWTSLGIERIHKFMRSCSQNYTKDAWILKLDIQWYFMSINRALLRQKNYNVIANREKLPWMNPNNSFDIISPFKWPFPDYLAKVIYDIIYNDPTENGIFRGKITDYIWLPKTKSLFYANEWCWLPIWNLTSQLFSNIYLNEFDHYIKEVLNIKYYWRYVDDFILIHNDKEYLKSIIPKIRNYLKEKVYLTLHPNKIYLQHVTHGVHFLGAILKPYRLYRWKRSVWNFYKKLKSSDYCPERSSLDSYLWLLVHYKHYKLVPKVLSLIDFEKMSDVSEYALWFLHKDKRNEIIAKINPINTTIIEQSFL